MGEPRAGFESGLFHFLLYRLDTDVYQTPLTYLSENNHHYMWGSWAILQILTRLPDLGWIYSGVYCQLSGQPKSGWRRVASFPSMPEVQLLAGEIGVAGTLSLVAQRSSLALPMWQKEGDLRGRSCVQCISKTKPWTATMSHLPHPHGQRESRDQLRFMGWRNRPTSQWWELRSHIAEGVGTGRGGELGCSCNLAHQSAHLDQFLHCSKDRKCLIGTL